MREDLFDMFKKLSGNSGGDVAGRFSVSRQYVHQLKNNYSQTHRLAFYGMLSIMADEKIAELKAQISELEDFKKLFKP
jgi:hypothetical protein